MKYGLSILLFALFYIRGKGVDSLNTNEVEAVVYLRNANYKLAPQINVYVESIWNYNVNINAETTDAMIAATKIFNEYQKNQSIEAKKFDWRNFPEFYQRQFEKLAVIGTSALEKEDEDRYTKVTNEMETIYSSAKTCVKGKCDLSLDPDLEIYMAESTDYAGLTEAWVNWRDVSGKLMRKQYIEYYTLGNKAATLNKLPTQDFKTLDDLWFFQWETSDIKQQTADLLEQLKPLYTKMHAYVRMHLRKKYPGKMPKDGTIPAQLLGNMWSQQWPSLMNTVEGVDPYPNVQPIDVTEAINKVAEKFFTDLGLEPMTETFHQKSVIEKIPGVQMVCHASAWDFFYDDDFRIKQCTSLNMDYLIITHHEMGHIQYYQQYKLLPTIYRDGANPGFHEAMGDVLAISVSTPKHLKKIGLLQINDSDTELMEKINLKFLMRMALDKVVFLPYAYIMDKWRWDVFSGEVSSDDMNRHWWKLRGAFQGVSPPVKRSENDFDPGAKFHIPASVEYIRYFVAMVLQFHFHKTLCGFGQKGVPLHECDIDADLQAGAALKDLLRRGSSEKWPAQLKSFTGSEKMDAQPLIDYFKPMESYLDEQIKNEKLGWTYNVDEYFENKGNDQDCKGRP